MVFALDRQALLGPSFGQVPVGVQIGRLVAQGKDRLDVLAVVPLGTFTLVRATGNPGFVEGFAKLPIVSMR